MFINLRLCLYYSKQVAPDTSILIHLIIFRWTWFTCSLSVMFRNLFLQY